jgi:uracil-DNA glycosylase
VNARDQLRRYLEQRREAGELELVLDHLTVDEVLALVGAGRAAASRAVQPVTPEPPATRAPESTPGPEHASANWREVLRDAGASPDAGTARREQREVETSQTDINALPGITIGSTDRELFAGVNAGLNSLEDVAKAVASCTRCPLYSTATNPVPGQGNPNAGFMVVGEAPGATEDEKGLAFVGAAGQLLTKILAAVNLTREDVFICNVLKHRPPGNRNPLPDEVKACSPYLIRQIELVQPKVILALGTFAAQTLLETKLAISKLRGQLHRYYGVPLIVTYHPAALLRNPSWKRPTWEDVQLARRILDRAVAQS